jgi:hypothetical protein
VPSFFGKTAVRLAIGPELAQVIGVIRESDLTGYGRAGIGVAFSRGPEYPGGAYFICVLLIEDSRSADPEVKSIGISTLPLQSEDGGRLEYAVAVILGR